MANDITGLDILSAYRANVNPNVINKLRKSTNISDKYKLTPGTEVDFNNAATFYMYAQTKNSDAIDARETELSSLFGNALLDYHKTYITDEKLTNMLASIYTYNIEIEKLYDKSKAENAMKILKNIYGIDPETLEISNGSYAYRVLLELRKRYITEILPRMELYHTLLRIREQFSVINTTLSALTSTQKRDQLNGVGSLLLKELQNLDKIGIIDPKIIYVAPDERRVTFLYADNSLKVKSSDATTTYKFISPNIWVYTNNSLIDFIADPKNPGVNDKNDDECNWSNIAESDIEDITNLFFIDKLFYGSNGDDGIIKIDSIFTDSVPTDEENEKILFSSKELEDEDKINKVISTYNFSSYEQQFLLFATLKYISNKLLKENSMSFTIDTTIEESVEINDDMCEILVDLQDGNTNNKLVSNEYDIFNNIEIQFNDDSHNTVARTRLSIKTGYLKDPYIALPGDSDSSTKFEFQGNEPISKRISNEVIASVGNVKSYIYNADPELYSPASHVYFGEGFFIFTDLRKAYAVLNAVNLYKLIKNLQESNTRLGNVYVNTVGTSVNKLIFSDLENTNLFSKLAHSGSKTYIYKDNITTLYDWINASETNFVKKVFALTDDAEDLDCGTDFNREYAIMLDSMKIYYEFNKPTESFENKTLENLKALEKRYASDVEAYYVLNYYNANYFDFSNIIVETDSQMFKYALALYGNKNNPDEYGLRPGTNDKYTTISISILYKEFNPIIRDITLANIQDRVISEYIQASSQNILNPKLYEYVCNISNLTNITAIDDTLRNIFVSLHTNPYIVRCNPVDEIVSYISGSIIKFGESSQDKNDIQSLLKIYSDTRNYFYKVLLNKAFVLEDQYRIYKEIYIKTYAIERFVSSRLTNLTDIKQYTTTDCRNFLISYGLKTLSDQVDTANFADSLLYKKRIIANYNNLMSTKGSRAIIDEFFKLFNYDTTEIELYKYLLYKDGSGVENVKFVPIPYSSPNMIFAIKDNAKKSKKYDEFLMKDEYWDENELTKNIVSELFESPVNTKYMGVDLKKDIYLSYIKSKYTLSFIRYLYNEFNEKLYSTDKIKYLDALKIELSTEESESDGELYSLLDVYNAVRILFAAYVTLSEKYNNETHGSSVSDRDPDPLKDSQKVYYGINPYATINNITINKTFLTHEMLVDLFTSNYVDSDDGGNGQFSTETITYYASGASRTPGKLLDGVNMSSTFPCELLFGQYTTAPVDYMIPLRLETTNTIGVVKYFDTSAYDLLKAHTSEVFTEDYESKTYDSEENTALDAIETAFKSVNIINFFNNLPTRDDPNYDSKDNNNKFQAIYYFEKFIDKKSIYPTMLDELGRISDPGIELKFPESNNFYSYLFERTMAFPINYLDGAYNISSGMNYTYESREILDTIFNNFFVVKSHDGHSASDIIGYLEPDDSSTASVLKFNKTNEFIKETYVDNPVMEKLFENGLFGEEGNFYTLAIDGDLEAQVASIADKLIAISNIINTACEQYQLLKLDLQFGESINNFFDFIKTCITFFISYTATLYESNLILKIETKNERIPLTYQIFDGIEQRQHEYFYYDEDITVEEIIA